MHKPDFYPRSPCGERLFASILCTSVKYISIHALLAESDVEEVEKLSRVTVISIHALLAESDGMIAWSPDRQARAFLSTLSLRRATCPVGVEKSFLQISIHALLAESDDKDHYVDNRTGISIHALLAESDDRS